MPSKSPHLSRLLGTLDEEARQQVQVEINRMLQERLDRDRKGRADSEEKVRRLETELQVQQERCCGLVGKVAELKAQLLVIEVRERSRWWAGKLFGSNRDSGRDGSREDRDRQINRADVTAAKGSADDEPMTTATDREGRTTQATKFSL